MAERIRRRLLVTPHGYMECREAGQGVPLVLLHATPTSAAMYDDLLPHLAAEGVHAMALSTMGYGASDRPPTPYATVREFSQAVVVGDGGARARAREPLRDAHRRRRRRRAGRALAAARRRADPRGDQRLQQRRGPGLPRGPALLSRAARGRRPPARAVGGPRRAGAEPEPARLRGALPRHAACECAGAGFALHAHGLARRRAARHLPLSDLGAAAAGAGAGVGHPRHQQPHPPAARARGGGAARRLAVCWCRAAPSSRRTRIRRCSHVSRSSSCASTACRARKLRRDAVGERLRQKATGEGSGRWTSG